MKKLITLVFAVLMVGAFALVGHHVQKTQVVADVVTPQLDPGGGGRG